MIRQRFGEPMVLDEVILTILGFSLRLHRWYASGDEQQPLHDHPWWFLLICLKGSYVDVREDGQEIIRAGSIRLRSRQHRHRVVPIQDCVTLILTGRWKR